MDMNDEEKFLAWMFGGLEVSEIRIGDVQMCQSTARVIIIGLECDNRVYQNDYDLWLRKKGCRHVYEDEEIELTVWYDKNHPDAIVYVHDDKVYTAAEVPGAYKVRHEVDMQFVEEEREKRKNGVD